MLPDIFLLVLVGLYVATALYDIYESFHSQRKQSKQYIYSAASDPLNRIIAIGQDASVAGTKKGSIMAGRRQLSLRPGSVNPSSQRRLSALGSVEASVSSWSWPVVRSAGSKVHPETGAKSPSGAASTRPSVQWAVSTFDQPALTGPRPLGEGQEGEVDDGVDQMSGVSEDGHRQQQAVTLERPGGSQRSRPLGEGVEEEEDGDEMSGGSEDDHQAMIAELADERRKAWSESAKDGRDIDHHAEAKKALEM